MNPVKGLSATPDVIKLEILKGLGANDLCKVSRLSKPWQKLTDSTPLWTQVAKNLRIRLIDPDNAKSAVQEYWKALPEINKKLETAFGVKSQIKDPLEQNLALQASIKEMLSNETMRKIYESVTRKMISELQQKYRHLFAIKTDFAPVLIALDLGIVPYKSGELSHNAWELDYAIFHLDYTLGFEQFFLAEEERTKDLIRMYGCESSCIPTGHFTELLARSILHGNVAFIKFLLKRINEVPPFNGKPIDWAEIYIASWFRAFHMGLAPNNPTNLSLLKLFEKYKTVDPVQRLVLFTAERNSYSGDLDRLAFLTEHFLPKEFTESNK